jgi:hypothetical protein
MQINRKLLDINIILNQLGISPEQFYQWKHHLDLEATGNNVGSFDKEDEIACTLAEASKLDDDEK